MGLPEVAELPALCVVGLVLLILGGRLIHANPMPWRDPAAGYLDEYLGYLYLFSFLLFPPVLVWLIVSLLAG